MAKSIAIAIEPTPTGVPKVSEHFGRCTSFFIYRLDDDNKIIKQEDQPNQLGAHSGACQLPPYVKQFNINVIIAGGMGVKAITQFNNFGIEVVTAPGLVPEEALGLYLDGQLKGYDPCNHNHDDGC